MIENKINTVSSIKSDNEENDNPENAFSKLMAIPNDAEPIRQCKMLLESMKEQLLFERNVFQKTMRETIPKSTSLSREKAQNYRNYERLLTYSKKKNNAEEFQRKSCGKIKVQVKKTRAKTLQEFMDEKKLRMLTEESKEQFNDVLIQNVLKNEKARQNLFDESILIERLHFIKRQQMGEENELCPVPKKFRGLDPKHMRIPQRITDEQTFFRRKYIHNQKSFQYFRKALKTENNQLKKKQKENFLVIMNLMNHFKDQALSTRMDDLSQQINQCIHRIFLSYAISGTEDISTMYKLIAKENMYKFMQDFGLEYKHIPKIATIIERYPITQFYFLEIIHLLSVKEGQFYADTNQFFLNKIMSRPEIYLPKQWQIYNNNKQFISKHLKVRKFKEKLEIIYTTFIPGKENNSLFNFDEMVEAMWMLKIYPFLVNKKKLRFFYLYCQNKETGISIDLIADIYICIALSREGNLEENVKEIVDMVINFSKSQKGSNQ